MSHPKGKYALVALLSVISIIELLIFLGFLAAQKCAVA
jgi:hypothetical protein